MNFHLILISIIEGLTEFLPISSTGHLIIAGHLMNIDLADPYIKFYLLFIQLGALLAGVALFSKRILTDKKTFLNVLVSFIPTAILGFVLYKLFKHLLEGNMILLAIMLILGGIIFMYLEKVFMKKHLNTNGEFGKEDISLKDAAVIGIAQAVAMVPGVSRSGATIIAGILRGIKKATIIEYTFLLALPTLGAAVLYDIYKSKEVFAQIGSYQDLIMGFTVAFVVGVATLRTLKKYLPKISLTHFGWYRIALGIIVILVFVI